MSRQTDRDQLVAQLSRELPQCSTWQVGDLARKLLRAGTTLQRLAEAQCNGDWPYDEGRQNHPPRYFHVCPVCEQSTRRSSLKMGPCGQGRALICPDCRTQARVTTLLAPFGLVPIFGGDPRGPVLKVIPPSYAERNAGKDAFNLEGIYVS